MYFIYYCSSLLDEFSGFKADADAGDKAKQEMCYGVGKS